MSDLSFVQTVVMLLGGAAIGAAVTVAAVGIYIRLVEHRAQRQALDDGQ